MTNKVRTLRNGRLTTSVIAAVAFTAACGRGPMIDEPFINDMGNSHMPDMIQTDPCKVSHKMTKGSGVLVSGRYVLSLSNIPNESQATISVYDPYSDEFGNKILTALITRGKETTVLVPGNLGGIGSVTITAKNINPAAFSAEVISCAKLPPPIMCDETKELTKSATLGIDDAIDLNGKYTITFYKIFSNPTAPVFRLNDLLAPRQNFIGLEPGTTIDFAFSDTVLVLSVSQLRYESEIYPKVTLQTCAKGFGLPKE